MTRNIVQKIHPADRAELAKQSLAKSDRALLATRKAKKGFVLFATSIAIPSGCVVQKRNGERVLLTADKDGLIEMPRAVVKELLEAGWDVDGVMADVPDSEAIENSIFRCAEFDAVLKQRTQELAKVATSNESKAAKSITMMIKDENAQTKKVFRGTVTTEKL